MVSFRKLCSKQNKMDCKVTFESTSKRSQVHNVKSTVCACILTSLAVSGASALIPLLLLQGSEGRITPSSKSLFHLYPITPSSGGGRGGAAEADRTGFLYIHLLPCFSPPFSFPFPLHVSGALLALLTPENFLKFYFSFLSPPLSIYINFALSSFLPQSLSFNFPLILSVF